MAVISVMQDAKYVARALDAGDAALAGDARAAALAAAGRWLKNDEVLAVLEAFQGARADWPREPAALPEGGALYLFSRRACRGFRSDRHAWRKKADGRTVKETHEKLKVGDRERLNCYYAHAEGEGGLQRRCYWLLDPARDDLVLVHYLRSATSRAGGVGSGRAGGGGRAAAAAAADDSGGARPQRASAARARCAALRASSDDEEGGDVSGGAPGALPPLASPPAAPPRLGLLDGSLGEVDFDALLDGITVLSEDRRLPSLREMAALAAARGAAATPAAAAGADAAGGGGPLFSQMSLGADAARQTLGLESFASLGELNGSLQPRALLGGALGSVGVAAGGAGVAAGGGAAGAPAPMHGDASPDNSMRQLYREYGEGPSVALPRGASGAALPGAASLAFAPPTLAGRAVSERGAVAPSPARVEALAAGGSSGGAEPRAPVETLRRVVAPAVRRARGDSLHARHGSLGGDEEAPGSGGPGSGGARARRNPTATPPPPGAHDRAAAAAAATAGQRERAFAQARRSRLSAGAGAEAGGGGGAEEEGEEEELLPMASEDAAAARRLVEPEAVLLDVPVLPRADSHAMRPAPPPSAPGAAAGGAGIGRLFKDMSIDEPRAKAARAAAIGVERSAAAAAAAEAAAAAAAAIAAAAPPAPPDGQASRDPSLSSLLDASPAGGARPAAAPGGADGEGSAEAADALRQAFLVHRARDAERQARR